MILDAVSVEGRTLVVATPSRDRRLAGGMALACAVFLLTAGNGPALVAALVFLLGGGALLLHRGLTIAFDTEHRVVEVGARWVGGGIRWETIPFAAVDAIGLRQMTNGADGSPPGYLPELRLADGRMLWLLPAAATYAENDVLLEAIREATGLRRRDDPRPSPFSH